MGPIGYTETSLNNYQSTLRNILEDRRSEGSVKCLLYIIYNKPTRCKSGSIVFINNYKYALHVSDALCVHHQESVIHLLLLDASYKCCTVLYLSAFVIKSPDQISLNMPTVDRYYRVLILILPYWNYVLMSAR